MRYLLHVRVGEGKKRTYRIDAKSEAEAKERLPSRLAPQERENVIIDAIEIDPASLGSEEPFGIFLNDNHA